MHELFYLLFKEFDNLSVEKKMLSTPLGFDPRSSDCRSTALIILFLSHKKLEKQLKVQQL